MNDAFTLGNGGMEADFICGEHRDRADQCDGSNERVAEEHGADERADGDEYKRVEPLLGAGHSPLFLVHPAVDERERHIGH